MNGTPRPGLAAAPRDGESLIRASIPQGPAEQMLKDTAAVNEMLNETYRCLTGADMRQLTPEERTELFDRLRFVENQIGSLVDAIRALIYSPGDGPAPGRG
jgi:hypothetical protein